MRTTRIILFTVLVVTILAVIALAIESNVTRGPAVSFKLVPERSATTADLESDAGAMVRRLQSLGYKDTVASVEADAIDLTMYGSAPKLRAALQGALAPASLKVRPVECAAPAFAGSGSSSTQGQSEPTTSIRCGTDYLLTASALHVDTTTGQPTRQIGPDRALGSVPSTSQAEDEATRTVLLPAGAKSGFASERLVAGPAEVDNDDVVSAGATLESSEWLLDLTLTTDGAKSYNALAKRQFHAYIAVDLDGNIVSAPLIEPVLGSFGSLGTKLEVEAGFTKSQAVAIADDLTSPLAVPLKLVDQG